MYQTKGEMSTCWSGRFRPRAATPKIQVNFPTGNPIGVCGSFIGAFLWVLKRERIQQGRRFMDSQEICGRTDRHVLADICGMRQRGHRGRVSAGRHRPARRVAGLRAERRDHGLCDRAYLRLPSQSSRDGRPGRRRPFPGRTDRCPMSIAQVVGAIVAAALLYVIASGAPGSTSARALRRTAMARIRPASTAWSSASSPRWS